MWVKWREKFVIYLVAEAQAINLCHKMVKVFFNQAFRANLAIILTFKDEDEERNFAYDGNLT